MSEAEPTESELLRARVRALTDSQRVELLAYLRVVAPDVLTAALDELDRGF